MTEKSNLFDHLIDKQWHVIKINNRNFLFKCLFDSDGYELLVLDLNSFNIFHSTQDDIDTKSEELNPKKIIPKEKVLNCLKSCLTETKDNCKFTIQEEDPTRIIFDLETKINESVGFKWTFTFESVDKSAIKDHLILPVLFNVNEKISRENELLEIIKNKDKLIEDYKSQGVKTNLKHISTEAFCLSNFDEALSKRSQERREKFFDNPEICLTLDSCQKVNNIYVEQYASQKRKFEEAQIAAYKEENEKKKQKVKLKKADSDASTQKDSATQQKALLDKQLEAERLKAEKKASKAKKPPLKL